uniref:Protein SDA1 n=1 Tax=Musa acuminata subsp. malaccensis TaxID=214687 RepID=A0A804HTC6_MUSAM
MSTPAAASAILLSPESLSAAGRTADKLSLPALQSKMKCDPDGYEAELQLLYRHFESSLHLFRHQSALRPSSDLSLAKDLGDFAMFLAHVTPFYPEKLANFPRQIADLLRVDSRGLPSSLRCHLAQALILLVNRKIIDIEETLELFMDLQILGDRTLRKLAFSHVVHNIRRMNQKHKNEAKNRKLQNTLFLMLQGDEEQRAKRSLVILCDLHRRRVWFDDRTANAICTACFHSSSRIMISALSFLLGYEQIEEEDDSEASSSEDDTTSQQPITLSREAIYKANHKGTVASKKKKKAKLQRVIRNMKRQQRITSQSNSSSYYSPLTHLKDAQGFAEKLFSRLQRCNERFEDRMMMLKVIARTVGLHRLILLNFYPLMNEDLLQDLVLYKKSHEKAVSSAARSLITLFREICPSLLVKKDRGRPVNPKARPKAYGEVSIATDVPDIELLEHVDNSMTDSSDAEASASDLDDEYDSDAETEKEDDSLEDEEEDDEVSDEKNEEDLGNSDNIDGEEDDGDDLDDDIDENAAYDEYDSDTKEDVDLSDDNMDISSELDASRKKSSNDICNDDDLSNHECASDDNDEIKEEEKAKSKKRKFADYVGQLNTSESSLRTLKRLTMAKMSQKASDETDGILSNEDFQRIKELKAKKEAKLVMAQQGLLRKGIDSKVSSFKIPSSEQLSIKPVDPAMLEVHIKRKLSKEERLALVRAGREDRGKYQARTAVKQKKTGGLSNRQKEHKKKMPLSAKRAKVARSRQEKKQRQRRSGKQFQGRKAWK